MRELAVLMAGFLAALGIVALAFDKMHRRTARHCALGFELLAERIHHLEGEVNELRRDLAERVR